MGLGPERTSHSQTVVPNERFLNDRFVGKRSPLTSFVHNRSVSWQDVTTEPSQSNTLIVAVPISDLSTVLPNRVNQTRFPPLAKLGFAPLPA